MPFDIQGAKAAGYSTREINEVLAGSQFDVAGAYKAGYSEEEVLRHLLENENILESRREWEAAQLETEQAQLPQETLTQEQVQPQEQVQEQTQEQVQSNYTDPNLQQQEKGIWDRMVQYKKEINEKLNLIGTGGLREREEGLELEKEKRVDVLEKRIDYEVDRLTLSTENNSQNFKKIEEMDKVLSGQMSSIEKIVEKLETKPTPEGVKEYNREIQSYNSLVEKRGELFKIIEPLLDDYARIKRWEGEYTKLSRELGGEDYRYSKKKISAADKRKLREGGAAFPDSDGVFHAFWDRNTKRFVQDRSKFSELLSMGKDERPENIAVINLDEGFTPGTPFLAGLEQVGGIVPSMMNFIADFERLIVKSLLPPLPMAGRPSLKNLTGAKQLDEAAKIFRERNKAFYDKIGNIRPTGAYLEETRFKDLLDPTRSIALIKEQAPLVAGLMATYVLNPVAGTVGMFAAELSETEEGMKRYEEETGETIPLELKVALPAIIGGVNAALEKLGLDTILGKGFSKKLTSKIAKALGAFVVETGTEGLQGANTRLGEMIYNQFESLDAGEYYEAWKKGVIASIPTSLLLSSGGQVIESKTEERYQSETKRVRAEQGLALEGMAGAETGVKAIEKITTRGDITPETPKEIAKRKDEAREAIASAPTEVEPKEVEPKESEPAARPGDKQELNRRYDKLLGTKEKTLESLENPNLAGMQREQLSKSLEATEIALQQTEDEASKKGIALENLREDTAEAGRAEVADLFKATDVEQQQDSVHIDEVNDIMKRAADPQDEMTLEEALGILYSHGIEKPEEGASYTIAGENFRDRSGRDIIRTYRGADISTIIEEHSEVWYKREQDRDASFDDKIKKYRADYEAKTGRTYDGDDIEWFSDLAIDYAAGGKEIGGIGKALRAILNKFRQYAQALLRGGKRLRAEIKAGHVSPELQGYLRRSIEEPTMKPAKKKVVRTITTQQLKEAKKYDTNKPLAKGVYKLVPQKERPRIIEGMFPGVEPSKIHVFSRQKGKAKEILTQESIEKAAAFGETYDVGSKRLNQAIQWFLSLNKNQQNKAMFGRSGEWEYGSSEDILNLADDIINAKNIEDGLKIYQDAVIEKTAIAMDAPDFYGADGVRDIIDAFEKHFKLPPEIQKKTPKETEPGYFRLEKAGSLVPGVKPPKIVDLLEADVSGEFGVGFGNDIIKVPGYDDMYAMVDNNLISLLSPFGSRLSSMRVSVEEAFSEAREVETNATQQLKTISKKKLNDIAKKNPEGFTVDRNGVPVTKGFVSGVTNGLGWKGQDIDFIHDVVEKNDQLGYGGWFPKGRAPEIDANMVFDTKDEALKFARDYSQEKIFDLDTFEEIELKYTKGEIAAFKKNPPDFTKPLNLPARKSTKQPAKKLQAIATQTKEFKRWFKKSKVVDESGEPLAVYHGTVATFEEFKSQKDKARTLGSDRVHRETGKDAFYFAKDPKIAGDYAKKEGGQIYPVYLSMQKPAIIDGKGESWTSTHRKVVAAIKSGKYDGIIVKNTADYYDSPGYAFENPTTVYIVLKPTQIKSIYNEGTFSEKDPRISQQLKKKKAKPKTKEEILYNMIDAYRRKRKPATIPTGEATPEQNRRYRHRLKALEDYLSHIMDSTTIDIGKASKWWSEDIVEMIAGMEKELDGISEDRTESLQMKLLLSITSQGMLLDLNHKQTLYLLHERRATGRYPLWKPGGATNIDTHAQWQNQLSKINRLEKYFKGDWEAITGWLIGEEITVKELREYLVAMGYTAKRAKTLAKDENGSTAVDATGYPAMIFGVKIGSMFGALHDVNLSALDIWMSRVEMVATGDINIDKKTGGLADLPKHREVFHEAIRNVAKKYGYEGHEIQSTSWVHIKELFHEMGTPRSSSYFTESMEKREKAYDKFTTTYAETISKIGKARARRAFARWQSLAEGLQKRTDPFKEPDGEEYKKAPLARQGGKTQQLKVVTLEDRKIAKEKKAAVDGIRMRAAKDKAEEIPEFIRNRRSYIDLHTLEMNSFIHELNKKTTKKERELIPFIIEKTEVPDALNRPDLQELDSKETRVRLRAIVASVEKEFKKTWISIVEANPDLDGKDILNYVTHIWAIPKNKRADVVTWFTSHNKWLESRYIETIAEGVSVLGLKPKTLDIGEILSIHSSTAHNVIANKKFVADIRALEQDGYRLVTKASLAPAGFVEIRHSAMRDPYTGAYLKAHPDLEKAIKVIFTEVNTTSIGHAYDIVAGVLKKTQLSLSLFHHIALTETAVALLGGVRVSKIIAELAMGRHPVFRNMNIARDAATHNLQLGASVDIPIAKIQEALKTFTRVTKGVAKPIEWVNEKWDAALWEYLHDGLKLFAYEHLVSKLNPKDENITKKKREISAFVNDTFGGQNMDILGINPNTVKWLQRSLLSADWQMSTIRQALSVTSVGAAYKENRMMRAKMGASFWIRAFIYYGILMNSLNSLFRKRDEEENPELYPKNMSRWDYTMLGNSVGSQTYLFIGRNKDGSEAYLRWGKQFRELPELLYSDIGFNIPYAAIKKVGGKANPMVHLAASVFTGHTASGYEIWDMKDKIGMDKAVGLMKYLLKAPLPFSTKNMMNERRGFKITDLFMPSGKGMSSYKARKFFKISIMDGDYNLWRETYLAAVRNRLPAQKINTQAISALKTDLNSERTGIVNSIEEIDKKIASEKDPTQQRYLQGKRARLIKRENDAKAALSVIERAENEMNRFRKDYNLK